MIRIKTTFSKDTYVITLFFMGKWITITHFNGHSSHIDADTLYEAGVNHLNAAVIARKNYEHQRLIENTTKREK